MKHRHLTRSTCRNPGHHEAQPYVNKTKKKFPGNQPFHKPK